MIADERSGAPCGLQFGMWNIAPVRPAVQTSGRPEIGVD